MGSTMHEQKVVIQNAYLKISRRAKESTIKRPRYQMLTFP